MAVKKIIAHWHNVYFYKKNDYYNNALIWIVMKISELFAHSIIAISQKVKIHNCELFKIDKRKVTVVYNAIDLSLVPLKKALFNFNLQIKIGSIGVVSEQKGYDILLKAFKIVKKDYPNCQLEIVGALKAKGHEKFSNEIINLVSALNLNKSVFFTGALPYKDVYEHLFSWNVFVLASKFEGFGLVLIEAMASGTPVIASNVDAIPEIVIDENTGLLFNTNNPEDLSKKILRLLKDKNLADILVNNARMYVENKFSINNMISKLEKIYDL